MSIFDLRQSVIDEYSKYVQSFLSIADERVRAFIEESLLKNQALWPDALLQLNPSYEMVSTVQDLVNGGNLHPLCGEIFRADGGNPIPLIIGDGFVFFIDVNGPDFPGETFRVLKEKEEKQYGEYRTRRLVLEAWDKLNPR